MLEIKNLRTFFFTDMGTAAAVDDVTLSIPDKSVVGVVGESGCGKSVTALSVLGLVSRPGRVVSGEILLDGENLLEKPAREMRRIRGNKVSMIFQEPMTSLNPVLKIREQIFENLKDPAMSKNDKQERAVELLKMVGIPMPEIRLNEYIHQYSGGMRQRAMIAIALAAQPKILVADEPTTALDVTIQDQIIKLLGRLKEQFNMSVVLITHDLGVVAQMCDNVAVMYAGRIVEMADTDTLLTKPLHPYTNALLRSVPTGKETSRKLFSIKGVPPDLTRLPPGCSFAPRCVFRGELCSKTSPELSRVGDGHRAACHYMGKLTDS
jgi:oligopeptide/dipeptide ABC transporter ATP-binding protein